jgi:hypothetical protein
MEFSDISLKKVSSLLLHAIHSLSYWRILKKTILISGFKNIHTKIREQENSSLFMNRKENELENQTKTRVLEDSTLCPETSNKNAVQEFNLRKKILANT